MSGSQVDAATREAAGCMLPTGHCEQRFHFSDDVGEWEAISGQCSQEQCTSLPGLEIGLCHTCQTPSLHSLVHAHNGTVRNTSTSIKVHA